MSDDARGIGDNNPPVDDPIQAIDPKDLLRWKNIAGLLAVKYPHILQRHKELMKSVDDWIDDHTDPEGTPSWAKGRPKPRIGDEQDLLDTTDCVKQVKSFMKDVDEVRKSVKAPIDQAGAAVQKFFNADIVVPMGKALEHVTNAQSLALIAKEEAEKTRRRAEQLRLAQEAARLAIIARDEIGVSAKESALQKAMEVDDLAEQAARAATASVAELTRTRTDLGQVTGLRVSWDFEVTQIMDLVMAIASGRQDLLSCIKVDEVYVRGLIRGAQKVRSIPGLHIFEEKKAR